MDKTHDPHFNPEIMTAGPSLPDSNAVLILLHGRGGSAQNMLELFDALQVSNVHALAPQAAGNSWYPQSFLAPLEANQPYLDSALSMLAALVDRVVKSGVSTRHVAILGFSQGACLATEFAARNPGEYGAIIALTGGLIGPPGTDRSYQGSLQGTPVLLGTSDPDMHVPLARVQETRDILAGMGAEVDFRSYPGMPHTVNEEELAICRQMLEALVQVG